MGSRNIHEGCIALGPWGSLEGKEWTYMPEGFIEKITVGHGLAVYSIEFQTSCSKVETQGFGFGSTLIGCQTDTICFNRNEYLMLVCGTLVDDFDYDVPSSIYFKTNENFYGPYGTVVGDSFSSGCKSGVIVGFHGWEDKCLTAIGVYVMPESLAFGPSSTYEGKILHELCSSISRAIMPREPGPWGVCGGDPWDDGVFSTVKQVHVYVGSQRVIQALQFEYLKRDGKSVMSPIHGEIVAADQKELVDIDVKDEYLIGISGNHGPTERCDGMEAILSISFHTNRTKYGPFGDAKGAGSVSNFISTASPGKVVGFHGRKNKSLRAIGVHIEYL